MPGLYILVYCHLQFFDFDSGSAETVGSRTPRPFRLLSGHIKIGRLYGTDGRSPDLALLT